VLSCRNGVDQHAVVGHCGGPLRRTSQSAGHTEMKKQNPRRQWDCVWTSLLGYIPVCSVERITSGVRRRGAWPSLPIVQDYWWESQQGNPRGGPGEGACRHMPVRPTPHRSMGPVNRSRKRESPLERDTEPGLCVQEAESPRTPDEFTIPSPAARCRAPTARLAATSPQEHPRPLARRPSGSRPARWLPLTLDPP
jgi:hypothetical protein